MKMRIEYDPSIEEEEIIIKCGKLTEKTKKIEDFIASLNNNSTEINFYSHDKVYFLPLDTILFFETEGTFVNAHTIDSIYKVKYKLYELESILPRNFIRISKSSIVNTKLIYAINHNITSSSLIQFYNSHKQVYVSRFYYKSLRQRLEERRTYEN